MNEKGITLLELLIAVTITVIITAGAYAIFVAQHKSYVKSSSVKEMQESAKAALEIIKKDINMAGYGLSDKNMAFCIIDGVNGRPDQLFLSYGTFLSDSDILNGYSSSTSIVSIGDTTVKLSTLDINGDGENDFKTHYALITDSTSVDTKAAIIKRVKTGNILKIKTPGTGLTGSNAAPANFFKVDTQNAELERNRQPLINHVVDLQVAYRDSNGTWYCDGTGPCPMNPFKPEDIDLVRVSIVLRTDRKDFGWKIMKKPGVENGKAGRKSDEYFYRVFTVYVSPRNLNL